MRVRRAGGCSEVLTAYIDANAEYKSINKLEINSSAVRGVNVNRNIDFGMEECERTEEEGELQDWDEREKCIFKCNVNVSVTRSYFDPSILDWKVHKKCHAFKSQLIIV